MFLLASALPIAVAGQVSVILVVLLLVTGFARLHATLAGERTPWGAAGALAVFALPLMSGFLNFELGLGLAMHFLAWHLRSEPGVRRDLLTLVFGFLLFICHLMGLGFAIVLLPVLGRLTGRSWREGVRGAAPLLAPVVAYLLFSPRPGGGMKVDASSLSLKKIQIMVTFVTGHAKTDIAFVGLAALVLAGLFAARLVRVRTALLLPGLLFVGLWLVLPFGIGGTANLDARFPGVFALLFLLALVPGAREARSGPFPAIAALGGLLLFRTGTLAMNFRSDGGEIATLRAALAQLPPGAAIVPVREERALVWDAFGWRPPLVYGAHLATLNGHYVAGTFFDPTQQPIVLRERYRPIADYRITTNLGATVRSIGADARKAGFDEVYVYYLSKEKDRPPALPVSLETVAQGSGWTLGRVRL